MYDSAEEGSSVTIRSNPYVRSGCEFLGWNTSPSGSGTSYTPGETIALYSNIVVYAQWSCGGSTTEVTLSYDRGDCSSGSGSVSS